jgi:phosphohistidine phosphatase
MAEKPLIIVMRHGRAVPAEEAGGDTNRWLTPEGRRDVEAVARLLPRGAVRVVYTSPLRRARETAEIVARVHGAGVVVLEDLAPGRAGCHRLDGAVAPGAVLVGHNPDLEELLCCLIGGGHVHLAAGAAAVVEAERLSRGAGRLVELITPRLAREALGGGG